MDILKWIYWGLYILGALLSGLEVFHMIDEKTSLVMMTVLVSFMNVYHLFLTKKVQEWLYNLFVASNKTLTDSSFRWIQSPAMNVLLKLSVIISLIGSWMLYKSYR